MKNNIAPIGIKFIIKEIVCGSGIGNPENFNFFTMDNIINGIAVQTIKSAILPFSTPN